MRNIQQETVDLLLSNKGFRKTGESEHAVSLTYKDKVTYHIGKEGWSAYVAEDGEWYYGSNHQYVKLFELIYPFLNR
ncbi:hypothetical protein [Ammoniphilus sp. 3BR4]|uniref:hypothetical protein n=1 Tax=Ammoniphilus sp. 3BR4 TaxID=3158265 RepID=UPI00346570AA